MEEDCRYSKFESEVPDGRYIARARSCTASQGRLIV